MPSWSSFRRWLYGWRPGCRSGFAGTWAELQDNPENHRLRRIVLKILDRLVRSAQSDGDMRPDVDTGDLALLIALLLRPVPGLHTELSRKSADRALDLMLDSLRACDDNQQLPHQRITTADLEPPADSTSH
ncbi:hypothetical protein ACIBQ3_34645 [Streptomyces rubiginosohelvolus]|uniref:SbtR family transcriptional regulator n=1 Tax=Streptomyces rubiginosohelvolus TaxID=67362 RepID=UPI0037B86EA1